MKCACILRDIYRVSTLYFNSNFLPKTNAAPYSNIPSLPTTTAAVFIARHSAINYLFKRTKKKIETKQVFGTSYISINDIIICVVTSIVG